MQLLEILNPWWKENKISKELSPDYKREVFENIQQFISKRQITIVSGLRRTGKTTLMYQIIEKLLNNKINPQNILYFSFDEKIEDMLNILNNYNEITNIEWKKEKCFLFLDEIQKLKDWSNKIKIIYDNFHNLKIIISGSSSFQLEVEAKSNLAGRHFLINVLPLSFKEYLDLRKSKIDLNKIKLWEDEIKKEFKNYLLKPYPEIINFEELTLIKSYIKGNIIEKVLKIDLPKRFKNINVDILTRLIDIFYQQPGTYINYDELSKDLKISKKTLIKHTYYLEFAYIIRIVKNFRPRIRIVSRKLQRIYPFHWSLGFGWSGKIDSETIAASFLDARYYWRKNEKEIDFLIVNGEILPIEVKEGIEISKNDLRHLIFFMKKFNLKKSLLIYNGSEEDLMINDYIIKKIPFWKFSFLKDL